jgi:sulfur carrier protein
VVIVVNGQAYEMHPGESIAAVLARLQIAQDARGIAVAVDGEVVPRACWEAFALPEDARVEVLTAMQGG